MRRTRQVVAIMRRAAVAALGAHALAASSSCGPSDASDAGAAMSRAACSSDPSTLRTDFCADTYRLVGSPSACSLDDAGTPSAATCSELCLEPSLCEILEDDAGAYVDCFRNGPCAIGRRPEGLAALSFDGPDATARYLAEAAFLERASVDAFAHLARELESYGAPKSLVSASWRSARDEVRHARLTRALAHRVGARVPAYRHPRKNVRSLERIAVENMVEGCVGEMFGAVVGIVQAEQAADLEVRRLMQGISVDEIRHASLAWKIHEWLSARLGRHARRRVRAAALEAIARLESRGEPDRVTRLRLGLPSGAQTRAILGELGASLWLYRASAELPARVRRSRLEQRSHHGYNDLT